MINTKLFQANSRPFSSLTSLMSAIPYSSCIQCSFEPTDQRSHDFPQGEAEVFYGITKDISTRIPELEIYLGDDEKQRAGKFHFMEDRNTYISCHGLLRLMLSKYLHIEPADIVIVNDKNNKPGIIGNPIYFNITHERNAFAFIISKHYYVGIDMEKVNQHINYLSITNSFFSKKERDFILKSKADSQDRFFLLWTRKEALLKALGTGITVDLQHVEVSRNFNKISRKSFDGILIGSIANDHYIFTERISEYFLSLAVPQKTKIIMNQINETFLNADKYERILQDI